MNTSLSALSFRTHLMELQSKGLFFIIALFSWAICLIAGGAAHFSDTTVDKTGWQPSKTGISGGILHADMKDTDPQKSAGELSPIPGFLFHTSSIGCAPLVVQLVDISQNATSWYWELPGGTPDFSTEQHPLVVYDSPGVYSITQWVFDDAGNSSSITIPEAVIVYASPAASFTYTVSSATASFTNTSGNTNSYLWNFGDGSTSTAHSPVHTYQNDGTYTVTLTVSNPSCGTSTATQSVTIVTVPTAGFTSSTASGCSPLTVQFTNTSSANVASWQWFFPGGTPNASTNLNPTVVYNGAGAYAAVLVVSNAAGNDTLLSPIIVDPSPTAGFTYTASNTTVSFTSTSVNSSSYHWDFGDGDTSNLLNPTHVFLSNGTYTVTLTVANDICGSDTIVQSVTVGTLLTGIRYVKWDAAGLNNGSSWKDAYTDLQDALDAAQPGDTIWVARGVYKPTRQHISSTANSDKTFYINKNIAVYGGFEGTENLLSQRDIVDNATILSGDLDDNDINSDGNSIAERFTDLVGENAFHVIWIDTVSNEMRLDGFTVTAGMATENHGGGIYNDGWSSGNGSSPVIENCSFFGNSAEYGGGAIANLNNGSPVLNKCVFSGNWGEWGGAIFNHDMNNPLLTNCFFSGNSAEYGGALTNFFGSPVLVNCVFSKNSASYLGGGVFNYGTNNTEVTNCSFYGNPAMNGGALSNYYLTSSAVLTNCIFWGNSSVGDGPIFFNGFATDTIEISYSLLDVADSATLSAGTIGTYICDSGMIYDQYPMFVDTAASDLHLKGGSPAVDKGNNDAVPSFITTDPDGNPRIFNGTVDMGAYESAQTACAALSLTIDDVSGTAGDILKIPVRASACFDSLASIFGTVHLDNASPFKFLGVEDAALKSLASVLSPETMTWACFPPQQTCQTLSQNDILFYLLVQADASAQQGDCTGIYFDSSPITMEALRCNGNNPPVPVQQVTTVAGTACVLQNQLLQFCGTVTGTSGSGVMADLTISNISNQTNTVVPTDSIGYYLLGGQQAGDYQIVPSKPDARCITPPDASKLVFGLLGIGQLDPYEKIAADITGDGIIDWKDRDSLVTALLNPDAALPWVFIAVQNPLVDPGGFNVPAFNASYYLPGQSAGTCDLDFMAVLRGALTPASIDCAIDNSDKPNSRHDNPTIRVEIKCPDNGLVEYILKTEGWQNIAGLQIPLGFDPEQLEFLYLRPGSFGEWANAAIRQSRAGKRVLPLLWYATDPETTGHPIADGTILLTLVFRAQTNTCPELSALYIAEADILPGAYDMDGIRMEFQWKAFAGTTARADETVRADASRILQNQPNPFADETSIPVFLPPNVAHAEIRITDIHGRTIEQISVGGRGEVSVPFRSAGLPGGVYFCSLFVDGRLIGTQRMVAQ